MYLAQSPPGPAVVFAGDLAYISGKFSGTGPVFYTSTLRTGAKVFAPAATASSHGDALAAGKLLQHLEREAVEPREVLAQVLLPDA